MFCFCPSQWFWTFMQPLLQCKQTNKQVVANYLSIHLLELFFHLSFSPTQLKVVRFPRLLRVITGTVSGCDFHHVSNNISASWIYLIHFTDRMSLVHYVPLSVVPAHELIASGFTIQHEVSASIQRAAVPTPLLSAHAYTVYLCTS